MRLFVALDLPQKIKKCLIDLLNQISFGRPVAPTQLHITLHFLGEVLEEDIPKIIQALTPIRRAPITVSLNSVGVFPNPRRARVLWVGTKPPKKIGELKEHIDTSLLPLGFAAKSRSFHPHITLCRIKQARPSEIQTFLEKYHRFASPDFTIPEFTLYSSLLQPSGSVYTRLQAFRLRCKT